MIARVRGSKQSVKAEATAAFGVQRTPGVAGQDDERNESTRPTMNHRRVIAATDVFLPRGVLIFSKIKTETAARELAMRDA
jgi:hypothetical protein